MPVSIMRQFSDLRSQGNSTISLRRELLQDHHKKVQAQMIYLQNNLYRIEEKIKFYKGAETEAKMVKDNL
jgi:hypothetical protein